MRRVAWIDHPFRLRSRATDDILSAVRQRFVVDEYFDEALDGRPSVDLDAVAGKAYDVVVLFQVCYRFDSLARLGCEKIVMIPMFDASGELDARFFLRYAAVRFVNFSRALHAKLKRLGLRSSLFRYFPPVPEAPRLPHSGFVGLAWPRTEALDWRTLRIVARNISLTELRVRDAPDPGQRPALPALGETASFPVRVSRWADDAQAYRKELSECHVVFAPRRREGLGLTFLEAMAAGTCVIAPDAPTMNEYILSGSNGVLFDADRPTPLALSREEALEIGQAARESAVRGRSEWLATVPRFLEALDAGAGPGVLRHGVSRALARWDRR